MKNSSRKMLAAAALAGLLNGAVLQQSWAGSTNTVAGATARAKGPKVHGCSGMNDCKGLGGCQSGDHGCKFKNSCKGKGGCEITQKDVKAWQKKQNALPPQS